MSDTLDAATELETAETPALPAPPPAKDWDSTAYFNPRQAPVIDGSHEAALKAWERDLLGDTAERAPSEWRIARKKALWGPGDVIAPPGGLKLQSVRDLDFEGQKTQLVGEGQMNAVLDLDGCFDPNVRGLIVSARRAAGGGRMDVPDDVVLARMKHGLQTTCNRIRVRIEGIWKDAAIRCGSVAWSTAQEDHYNTDGDVYGAADIAGQDTIDLCKYAQVCGNGAWSNNRRHEVRLKASGVGTGILTRYGADVLVTNCWFDNVRDPLAFAGATSKMTVLAGEAENCQRFLVDHLHFPHDKTCRIMNFYSKHDLWRPELPGALGWKEPYDMLGTWGTRGGLILDNVSFSFIPVRRHPKDGKLYYVTNIRTNEADTGNPLFDWTNIPAPRIGLFGSSTHIKTVDCAAHGYKAGYSGGKGYNELFYIRPDSGGFIRHEGWKDTTWDGLVTKKHRTAINQYPILV